MGTGVTPTLQGPRRPFYRSAYALVNLAASSGSTAELAVATNVQDIEDRIVVLGRRVPPTLREKPPGDRAEQRDRDDQDPDPFHTAHRTYSGEIEKGLPCGSPFERRGVEERRHASLATCTSFGAPDPRPGWVMN